MRRTRSSSIPAFKVDGPTPAKRHCRANSIDSRAPTNEICHAEDPEPAKRRCRSNSVDAKKPANRTRRLNSFDTTGEQSQQDDNAPKRSVMQHTTKVDSNHDLRKVVQMNMDLSNELFNLKKNLKQTSTKSSLTSKQLEMKSLECVQLDKEILECELVIKKLENERFTDNLIDFNSNGNFWRQYLSIFIYHYHDD